MHCFQVWQLLHFGLFITLLLPLMVRNAHSKLQARAIYCRDADAGLQDALKYIKDMRKTGLHGMKWSSVPSLLRDFLKMKPEKLAPSTQTVYQHLNNIDAKSKAQVAANQQILNTIEDATLVSFIQKLATTWSPADHAACPPICPNPLPYTWVNGLFMVLLIQKLSSKEPEGSLDQEPWHLLCCCCQPYNHWTLL